MDKIFDEIMFGEYMIKCYFFWFGKFLNFVWIVFVYINPTLNWSCAQKENKLDFGLKLNTMGPKCFSEKKIVTEGSEGVKCD